MGGKFTGVRAISESSIEITFTYRGTRCRERIKFKPTAANLKAAANHRGAILDAIARGTFDYAVTFPYSPRVSMYVSTPGHAITIKDYLSKWLAEQRQKVKSSTFDVYRKDVNNRLIPAFGKMCLSDLKRHHVRDWASQYGATAKRITNIISPLRIALHQAVDDDLIEINPLHGWTYKRNEPPKGSDIDPFTEEEQTAILAKLKEQEKNLFQFAFWTGLRTSEMVALQWSDIDWTHMTMVISRAKTQVAKEAETPKTKSGNRKVKLLSPAIEALQTQRAYTFLHSDHVFHNPRTNEPWKGDKSIREAAWIPALKRAGVRYRRPYQTRHTYASMMLSAGENPAWIAGQMGHSDLYMVFRVYGKWIKDADPQAGLKAVEMFNKNAGKKLAFHSRNDEKSDK